MGETVIIIQEARPRRWLKLKAASEYCGLGRHLLKELAARGAIIGGKVRVGRDPEKGRRDWLFDRYSLDAYIESQLRPAKVNQAVNDISAEMGL